MCMIINLTTRISVPTFTYNVLPNIDTNSHLGDPFSIKQTHLQTYFIANKYGKY